MRIFAFITADITPEEWADFATTAAVPPQIRFPEPLVPYVLVHSPSQQDLTSATTSISTSITTSFKGTPWLEIKDIFLTLTAHPIHNTIYTDFFLILDEQSKKDRKVILVQCELEYAGPDGAGYAGPSDKDDIVKFLVWKMHRVPFEMAWHTSDLLMERDGQLEEPWLKEVAWEEQEKEA